MAARKKMTAKQRIALRKAQLASARKRRGKGKKKKKKLTLKQQTARYNKINRNMQIARYTVQYFSRGF